MKELLKSFLALPYEDAEYDVRIKAGILLYFSIILMIFFPGLLISNMLKGNYAVKMPLLILPADMAIILAGIALLRAGHYRLAVNVYIVTMAVSFIVYILLDTFFGIMSVYHVNTFYYVFIIIVFAALFGSWRWLIALPILFTAFSVTYFLSMQEYMKLGPRILKGVLVDLGFALVLVSSLSILIKKVNQSVILKLEEYNTRLRHEMEERISLERQMLSINEAIRERIGQELHDDLGQHLVAIKMRSELLKRRPRGKALKRGPEVDRIVLLIDEAIRKVRRIAQGLGSVRLNADNFISALRRLASDAGEMYDITCGFDYDRMVVIHDDLTAINLYRIAQESITNAVKHGRAKNVWIELESQGDTLVLTVRNDGTAMEGRAGAKNGLGIRLMRYRADLIGGNLSIHSARGKGTVVRCTLESRGREL